MKTKLFLTGLALMAITTIASAQDPVAGQGRGNGRCNGTGKGAAFVDKNNDGICDNFENGTSNATANRGNRNCNGTGNGQGRRQGRGQGRNFVDTNNNGICDYNEVNTKK